jgi:serine protease Do
LKKPLLNIIICIFCIAELQAQPISSEHNYAMNTPGIVMVQAVFSATVYVNELDMNERKFSQLVDSVKKLDTSGTLLTPGQKLDMVVRALYKSPLRYFVASNRYFRQVHRVQTMGTGFLITGDGYLLTNCHIIDRDSAFIRGKFIQSTYQEVTESNINALQSSWAMTLTEQQRSLLSNAYGLIYSQLSSMILFDLKKEIFVSYRADDVNGKMISLRKTARIIRKGQPMPGKDVAILKIDGVENLPVLHLSDEPTKIGAQVIVIGYPEPATSNAYLSSETGMEPTLTSGIVSAIKKSVRGWPVIQMDALISHGSSGSPVCDDRGEVIGLATFGSLEQGGVTLASGYNFAIPVSIVRAFMDSSGINPALSKTSRIFNEALGYFYQQYYRKALNEFERVGKVSQDFPGLDSYMAECRSKIAKGNNRQFPPRQYVFWMMVLIAFLAVGYLVFFRKPKKH